MWGCGELQCKAYGPLLALLGELWGIWGGYGAVMGLGAICKDKGIIWVVGTWGRGGLWGSGQLQCKAYCSLLALLGELWGMWGGYGVVWGDMGRLWGWGSYLGMGTWGFGVVGLWEAAVQGVRLPAGTAGSVMG